MVVGGKKHFSTAYSLRLFEGISKGEALTGLSPLVTIIPIALGVAALGWLGVLGVSDQSVHLKIASPPGECSPLPRPKPNV